MDFPGFVLRYRAVHLVSIAVDGSIAKGLCQTIDLGGRFSSAIALLEGWIQLFDYRDSRLRGCRKDGFEVLAEAFVVLNKRRCEDETFQLVVCKHDLDALVILAGEK